jgi:RNA polymerase sigma-70 factor, ECF subfamily
MDDLEIIAGLRARDETAFVHLVDRYHNSLLRIALLYLPDPAIAEEVAQETWLQVFQGIDRFEGRSSLKTWIFGILNNQAKSRARKEGRSVPFSALNLTGDGEYEPSVSPDRFQPPYHPLWPGGWLTPPSAWEILPEDHFLMDELTGCIRQGLNTLSENQRAILVLRDLEGWSSEEVCNVFNISETNQRVLLHRARSKVRQMIESYFETTTK